MSTGKSVISKKYRGSTSAAQQTKSNKTASDLPEELPIPNPVKSRVPFEIEDPDSVHAVLEEKPEDDPMSKEEDGDELGPEEPVLDEEELNPFGDKWEQ